MPNEFPEHTEKKGSCDACGNSPTNHLLTKITSTLDVFLGEISKSIGRNIFFQKLNVFTQYTGDVLIRFAAWFFQKLGFVKYAHNPEASVSYRSRVIWEEAKRRGIEMEQMIFLGKLTDTYRARMRNKWFYFESLPMPTERRSLSQQWVDDKVLLKRVLKAHKIPVPAFTSARSFAQAERFLVDHGGPVVVKPRVGTRGRHTTVSVRTKEDLVRAVKSAKTLCSFVSVEEELNGSVCRGTVVDHKLVGFFQADPGVIVGDGLSSIQQLIEMVNKSRQERIKMIEVTDENLAHLKRRGYTLESVPEKGVTIAIGHRTGRLFGGKTRELLDTVHPRLREELEKATRVINAPIIGFDLIIENPEADPDQQRWGIIEANTLPFIDLHYLPLFGKPSNPASAVWDLWGK